MLLICRQMSNCGQCRITHYTAFASLLSSPLKERKPSRIWWHTQLDKHTIQWQVISHVTGWWQYPLSAYALSIRAHLTKFIKLWSHQWSLSKCLHAGWLEVEHNRRREPTSVQALWLRPPVWMRNQWSRADPSRHSNTHFNSSAEHETCAHGNYMLVPGCW